jgi:hypothetical protein
MNNLVSMLLLAAVLSTTWQPGSPAKAGVSRSKRPGVEHHTAEFRSMQQKIEYLRQNAARPAPDPRPTELSEAEVNAYFNEGGVELPKGVSRVRLSSQPAVIDGRAQIDFDALTEGRRLMNPLLSLFSGTHQVRVAAQAVGEAGSGSIRVQSVYLDGMEVPQMALEFFARYYLTPKYPNVGVNTTFRLPLRIASAIVEAGRVRLVQR